jgi:anthranilate phosphoribosyltransferase
MDISEAIARLIKGFDLNASDMKSVMRQIMSGGACDAQIGGFLVALSIKGETITEISAAVEVLRELVSKVPIDGKNLIDIVGTGGDGANLFNVSTAASFVVAAAGGRVAKHGNRSVSSKSGSADVLKAAGVKIDLTPSEVAGCIDEVGIGFMFAPLHHSAMQNAAGPRRALGIRTIFNVLGPMVNPASVSRQLIGVYSRELCAPVAQVMGDLGAKHIMVVHSEDGLDEISVAASTHVAEFNSGVLSQYEISPKNFFTEDSSLSGLVVDDAFQSLQIIKDAFGASEGQHVQPAVNMISLNAGAALYVGGLAENIKHGFLEAQNIISNGLALEKLTELIEYTQGQHTI